VDRDNLINRMDYKYNLWKSIEKNQGKSLNDIGAIIFRGKPSKKDLVLSGLDFLHTSDLQKSFELKKYQSNSILQKLPYAQKGDIIIPRVGKRLEKLLVIQKGTIIISDCVYVIRVEEKYRQNVVNALISDEGKNWIKAHSHGVCAKVISKTDLLSFRVKDIQ
ncbi:hypothetical protein, partial [uncultured Flavobacterium sp.]|uniref:hypothetical protein n=1 Tax=uncultured Flavobacterium sp. TaxID=165435 RepID=UPI0025EE42A2